MFSLGMQVRTILDNDDRQLVDPAGHALPPCIVMERGEALDLWSERNAPDRAQAFTVRHFFLFSLGVTPIAIAPTIPICFI